MGTSNIDLTIISPQLIRNVAGWVISNQESISDHSIIKYAIRPDVGQWKTDNIQDMRYITKKKSLTKFQENVLRIVRAQFCKNHDAGADDLDETLSSLITVEINIEKRIDEFSEALKLACNKSFPTHGATKKVTAHKTVPWWTEDLTVLRKRTNAQRRLYQRSRNNNELRESAKHSTPKVKQRFQQPSKGKKMNPGKSNAA
jgi:hypothetical protein